MKTKLISSLLCISALVLSSLAFSETAMNKQEEKATQKMKNDGIVIAWIAAIDNFEIQAAKVADGKTLDNQGVKNFVTMIGDDHSKNLKELDSLSQEINTQPVDTSKLDKFKEGGAETLTKWSQDTENFQKDFISGMVTGHADALKVVNTDLLKKVSNSKLKTFLISTRNMIAHHWKVAKDIQAHM